MQSAMWRLLHYQHDLTVYDPLLAADAAAFRAWQKLITVEMLKAKPMLEALIIVATKETERAEARAVAMVAKKFAEWIQEGPAQGLKRQHLLSRTASGWTPGRQGAEPDADINEFGGLDGLNAQELKQSLQPSLCSDSPLASQKSANAERGEW